MVRFLVVKISLYSQDEKSCNPCPTLSSLLCEGGTCNFDGCCSGDSVQEIEISPQSIAMAETLAARVESQGGAALLIDYGQDAPYPGSLQAIKDHRFIHFLSLPGDADLSCRVDFSAIK